MPFTKHVIEPIKIAQCPIPSNEKNELECLSNLTLANIIRQLSSLGEHADQVFAELIKDAVNIGTRTRRVNERIENLRVKISNLDIQSEEVNDFNIGKPYKSSSKLDDKVVSRHTMPEAMQLLYNNAEPPPCLEKLNPYRDDGRDCLKFYTDPDYFFNLWREQIMQDDETKRIEKKKKKKANKHDQNKQQQLQQQGDQQNIRNNNSSQSNIANQREVYYASNSQLQQQQQQQQLQQQKIVYNTPIAQNGNNSVSSPSGHVSRNLGFNNQQQYSPMYEAANNTNNRTTPVYMSTNQNATYDSLAGVRYQSQQNVPSSPHGINERPMMPPPPIPKQQAIQQNRQQQHYGSLVSDTFNREDLPPPPSPPDHDYNRGHQNNDRYHKTLSPPPPAMFASTDMVDNNELPLPPPPIELVQDTHDYDSGTKRTYHHQLSTNTVPPPPPPPPPAPPLPDFSFPSTTTSASKNSSTNDNQQKNAAINEFSNARDGVLDAIRNRQFKLKAIKENEKRTDAPVSNVAAILDILSQRRAHMEPSSEEDDDDDENDWDD